VPNSADEIIKTLNLQPHPEGGFFHETWRDSRATSERGSGTAIYYLLRAGEMSHWHRVDAVEIWHFYAGAPLELRVSSDGIECKAWVLDTTLNTTRGPQFIIPAGTWQSARSLGEWTLVGCTVSPAFDFAGFEMAPPNWSPQEGLASKAIS